MARKNLDLSVIQELLYSEIESQNVIPVKKEFIYICEDNPSAALMLHQLVYWTDKAERNNGWIYKSAPDWYDEIGLTLRRVVTARNDLVKLNYIEVTKHAAEGHNCFWYKVKVENVRKALESLKNESSVIKNESSVIKNDSSVITDDM